MSEYVIEEFQTKHFIQHPAIFKSLEAWTDADLQCVIDQMVRIGTFRVIQNSSEILAICGFLPLHTGACEVVMFPGVALMKQYFTVCKILLSSIAELRERYHRIVMVAPDTDLHHRFAEFLGFTQEGIMRKYNTLGENFILYSIVEGD